MRISFQAALHFPDTVSAAGLSAADFMVLRGPKPGANLSAPAALADTGNGMLAPAPGREAEACACGVDPDAPPERPPTSSARSALCYIIIEASPHERSMPLSVSVLIGV